MNLYNIVFIPLQFAFLIPFEGFYFVFEILTIFTYSLDIVFRSRNIFLLVRSSGVLPTSSNDYERRLRDDKEKLQKRLLRIKIEIACSAIALIPFSLLFQRYNP